MTAPGTPVRLLSVQPGTTRGEHLDRPPALRAVFDALADRLHAAGDAEARAWGWEVTRTRWGGRSYRDPRIAALASRGGHPTRRSPLAALTEGRHPR